MSKLVETRFLSRAGLSIGEYNECWLWPGSVYGKGYGRFKWKDEGIETSHVAAYVLFVGKIPKKNGKRLQVCHSCDTPSCWNPNHLWLGTNRDNILDCIAKGRFVGRKKLSAKQVKKIYKLYKTGRYSVRGLARKFNLDHATISRINNKQSYRMELLSS